MSTHPYVSEYRESHLSEWRDADMTARITLEAPELRHVSDPAPARCVVTTGRDARPIHIGGAVSRKSASPYAGYGPHRRPSLLRRIARRMLVASVSLVGSVNVLMWLVGIAAAGILLTGCGSDAQIASHNLSRAADNFEVNRRIVFYNGITDSYILTIEGRCSIETTKSDSFQVTCKTGEAAFKKHFLGLSDNVTYFAEQIAGTDVSVYHYRVVFKPQSLLPDFDFRGDAGDVVRNRN